MLGVVAVTADSAVQAVELLGGKGVTILTAGEVVVDADEPEIPVGIDGETIMMATPVRCAVRPRALRGPGTPGPARGPAAQVGTGLAFAVAAGFIPLRAGTG